MLTYHPGMLAYLLPLALTVVMAFAGAGWVRREYDREGADYITGFLISIGLWAIAGVLTLLLVPPEAVVMLLGLETAAIVASAVTWFGYSSAVTGRGHQQTSWYKLGGILLTAAPPLLSITNPMGGIMWSSVVEVSQPFTYTAVSGGAAHRAILGAAVVLLAVGSYWMIEQVLEQGGTLFESGGLIVGSVTAIGGLAVLSVVSPGMTVTHPTSIAAITFLPLITSLGVTLSSAKHHITPIARQELINSVDAATVTVNNRGEILDHNSKFTEIASSEPIEGSELQSETGELAAKLDEEIDGTVTISVGEGPETKHYQVASADVERGSNQIARAYAIRNVTDSVESKQQMNKYSMRLEEIAECVAHEFRNPLTTLLARSSRLREMDDDEITPEEVREHAEAMYDHSQRLNQLMDDFLLMAENAQTPDNTRWNTFSDVVDGVKPEFNADEEFTVVDDGEVYADRLRYRALMRVLLREADNYHSSDSPIQIGVSDGEIFVKVEGADVPDRAVDDLFAHGKTHPTSGTGLGLALVGSIADAQGWSTEAEYDDSTLHIAVQDVETR